MSAAQITGHATADELVMIRDALILPHMITMIEKNRGEVDRSMFTARMLFVRSADVLLDRLTKELIRIRRELAARKIKILEEENSESIIRLPFICRGYRDSFGIIKEVAKAEMSVQLGQYINNIFKDMWKE